MPSQIAARPFSVLIGGQQAAIANLGQAVSPPGVTSIAVQIPFGLAPSSAAPLTLQVGSLTSPAGVTVAIGN
jgi:uncharacterized protein (TIGR03437 family)